MVRPVDQQDQLTNLMSLYDMEEKKGANANHDKLYNLAINILTLFMRTSSREDQQHIQRLQDEMENDVKKVQNTYNPWSSLAFTSISVVINVVAGVAGVRGAIGQASGKMAKDTVEAFANFSKAGGTIGSGLSPVAQVFDNKAGAKRTGEQHTLDVHKDLRNNIEHANQKHKDKAKEGVDTLRDFNSAKHQANQEMMRS